MEDLNHFFKKYVVASRHSIKSWQTWLGYGVLVGVLIGIALVANREGRLGAGRAAAITHQASAEFSTTQGQGYNNWYYLDGGGNQMACNVSGQSCSADNPNAGQPAWQGNEQYLLIWRDGGHPGQNADAVRRWKAPQAGTVNSITGTMRDTNSGCTSTNPVGDGVSLTVKKNGASLLLSPLSIANGNTAGVSLPPSLSNIAVAANDTIDFVLNKQNNNYCDSTFLDPVIAFTPSSSASTGNLYVTVKKDGVEVPATDCSVNPLNGSVNGPFSTTFTCLPHWYDKSTPVPAGTYSFAYTSGGPSGFTFQNVTCNPSNCAVPAGGTLTAYYNFTSSSGGSGTVKIYRQDASGTSVANTKANIDAVVSTSAGVSANPAIFNGVDVSGHGAHATDLSGYTETAGTCDETANPSCTPSSFAAASCGGSDCNFGFKPLGGKTLKIVYRYTSSPPPPPSGSYDEIKLDLRYLRGKDSKGLEYFTPKVPGVGFHREIKPRHFNGVSSSFSQIRLRFCEDKNGDGYITPSSECSYIAPSRYNSAYQIVTWRVPRKFAYYDLELSSSDLSADNMQIYASMCPLSQAKSCGSEITASTGRFTIKHDAGVSQLIELFGIDKGSGATIAVGKGSLRFSAGDFFDLSRVPGIIQVCFYGCEIAIPVWPITFGLSFLFKDYPPGFYNDESPAQRPATTLAKDCGRGLAGEGIPRRTMLLNVPLSSPFGKACFAGYKKLQDNVLNKIMEWDFAYDPTLKASNFPLELSDEDSSKNYYMGRFRRDAIIFDSTAKLFCNQAKADQNFLNLAGAIEADPNDCARSATRKTSRITGANNNNQTVLIDAGGAVGFISTKGLDPAYPGDLKYVESLCADRMSYMVVDQMGALGVFDDHFDLRSQAQLKSLIRQSFPHCASTMPNLPDLTVVSVRTDPPKPAEGQQVKFYATILNSGRASVAAGKTLKVGFSFGNLADLPQFVLTTTAGLGAGQQKEVGPTTVTWRAVPGLRELLATVDYDLRIKELSEQNNVLAVQVDVDFLPPFVTLLETEVRAMMAERNMQTKPGLDTSCGGLTYYEYTETHAGRACLDLGGAKRGVFDAMDWLRSQCPSLGLIVVNSFTDKGHSTTGESAVFNHENGHAIDINDTADMDQCVQKLIKSGALEKRERLVSGRFEAYDGRFTNAAGKAIDITVLDEKNHYHFKMGIKSGSNTRTYEFRAP